MTAEIDLEHTIQDGQPIWQFLFPVGHLQLKNNIKNTNLYAFFCLHHFLWMTIVF